MAGFVAAAPAPTPIFRRAPLPSPTGIPSASSAEAMLERLTVAPLGSNEGYDRDKFPHWITQSGECNTREVVLKRDGRNVTQNDECVAVAGTWPSPYDGKIWTDADDIQIDHMIPLANAWKSGASEWTTDQREAFANDLTRPQLWAVTGTVNNDKSDSSPDEWKPPLSSFYCEYASSWVAVKENYNLTVTSDEKSALADMLDTC
ncbi:hypothetical protein OHC33_009519 [Knufia fluminis]|uniref:GmrSD restriction endonucleases C-terminal domain-containing protein n=1 Tax=Knufia fluminis TaxID=191047 RepID=A0AAN8F1C4_9EURO|nr:hypothetical protein OHC33_009519 [Knufia fluminis]